MLVLSLAEALPPALAEDVATGFPALHDVELRFRVPTPAEVAVQANRLLRFRPPVTRQREVFERFLGRHWLAPKLPRNALAQFPTPLLEALAHCLVQAAFPRTSPATDAWLALLLVVEETAQFLAGPWVAEDICALGRYAAARLHGYYFELDGPRDSATLRTVLAALGYRMDLLGDTGDTEFGYLACRALTRPWPWSALLAATAAEDPGQWPWLSRFRYLAAALQQASCPLFPVNEPDALARARAWLGEWLVDFAPQASAASGVVRPLRQLVIVEGTTEELLLPAFARAMGVDFLREGVLILPAGGKNPIRQLYRDMAAVMAVPVFVLVDRDAGDTLAGLSLRPQDSLCVLAEGEFEDTYDLDTVLAVINARYDLPESITSEAFEALARAVAESPAGLAAAGPPGRVRLLQELWKAYRLGDFDKIAFAGCMAEALGPAGPVPEPIRRLVEAIMASRDGTGAPA